MIVNLKPFSVNGAWNNFCTRCKSAKTVKTTKSTQYKNFEKEALYKLKMVKLPPEPFEVHIEWGFSNAGADADNPTKPFIDILQKKYGFNDSKIYKYILLKKVVPKGMEYIDFNIMTYIEKSSH